MTPTSAKPTSAKPTSDEMALERTRLAHERTMMAWIRTGTSLISFGFSIYKFFDSQGSEKATYRGIFGPRPFGFAMILTGVTVLALAAIEHRRNLKALREQGLHVPFSLATAVGGVVFLLGLMGLIAVILRQ